MVAMSPATQVMTNKTQRPMMANPNMIAHIRAIPEIC